MKRQRKPFKLIKAQIGPISVLDLIHIDQRPIELLGQVACGHATLLSISPDIAGEQFGGLRVFQSRHLLIPHRRKQLEYPHLESFGQLIEIVERDVEPFSPLDVLDHGQRPTNCPSQCLGLDPP